MLKSSSITQGTPSPSPLVCSDIEAFVYVSTGLIAVFWLGHQHWLTLHHDRLLQALHALEAASRCQLAFTPRGGRRVANIAQLGGQSPPSGHQVL